MMYDGAKLSKGGVLKLLQQSNLSCVIPPLVLISRNEWEADSGDLISNLLNCFQGNEYIAVRSSSRSEDNELDSKAGAYLSILNVPSDDHALLTSAIDDVFHHMKVGWIR